MNGTLSSSFVAALRLYLAPAGRILTTIPHPSQARLDLEAPADLKPQPPGPPATASFPHSISLVTERDK